MPGQVNLTKITNNKNNMITKNAIKFLFSHENILLSHEEPKEEPQRKTQRNLGRNSLSTKSLAVSKTLNPSEKSRP